MDHDSTHHHITVHKNFLNSHGSEMQEQIDECVYWCYEQFPNDYNNKEWDYGRVVYGVWRFSFVNSEDATAFKLRFSIT
jgi:hypothetical protein